MNRTREERPWHAIAPQEATQALDSDERGLASEEASRRLERHGENRLPEPRRRGPLRRLLAQFHNILIYVLIVAGAVTSLLGEWLDAGVIFAVVVINATIGFVQEGKAERAMDAIRKMLRTRTRVLRDGDIQEIDAVGLVPGDVILLESGDRVPADARLLSTRGLRVDESSLTGESVPVDKTTEALEADTVLADRRCMSWSGTLVTSGRARAVVVATGERTELGRISRAAEEAEEITTPLLRRIHHFGRQLTVVILVLAALTLALGTLWRGEALEDMFFAAVGLAVAAIPEGLPAIITITLALGVQTMARRNAIVRRLPAVETLGSVTVICSDKTGTLTRNEMTVRGIRTPTATYSVSGTGYRAEGGIHADEGDPSDDSALEELLLAGVLCNDSRLQETDQEIAISGDPMEAALLVLARKRELDPAELQQQWPRTDHIPFESENRYMATLHHDHHGHGRILVKGAPEQLLSMCEEALGDKGESGGLDTDRWREAVDEFGREGQRTIALAMKSRDSSRTTLDESDVASGLTLLGLVALEDPPRQEAIEAVSECHGAGIRVKMITGDHLGTALAIGRQLGIGDGSKGLEGAHFEACQAEDVPKVARDTDVFARFSPEHKLTLVRGLREGKEITAMTGDGVNDAPALRSADVGVAMGRSGTEAAREASEIVLADDNFATIATAVRTGRAIYDNIRKSLLFILPTNGGQSLLILAAVAAGLALPVTPVQILWVNMVTAVTLALALAFEPPEKGIMERPPRPPGEPILTPFLIWRIGLVSVLILVATFTMFNWHMQAGLPLEVARTAAVNTVIACQVFYLYNCRYLLLPVFNLQGLSGNPWVPGAIILIVLLQAGFTYLPPMQLLFGTTPLPLESWLGILAVSLPILFLVEGEKAILRRRARPSALT